MANKRRIPIPLIGFVFLLLPSFKPGCLVYLAPTLEQIFDLWRIAAFGVAGALYLLNRRFSKIMLMIVLFECTRLYSTIMGDGDYWRLAVNSCSVLCFCMTMELGVQRNLKGMLRAMILLLCALCAINTIAILLYPEGLYKDTFQENWILGYDNVHVLYILPLLCAYVLYANARRRSLVRKLCFLAAFSLSVFITWSLTSMVGIALFVLLALMNDAKLRPRWLNPYTYLALTIVLFAAIMLYHLPNLFSDVITNVLHKEFSMSDRLLSWKLSMRWIARHPIIGNGLLEEKMVLSRIHLPHCHNYYLQVLYEGGAVGFVFFAGIMLTVAHRLFRSRRQEVAFVLAAYLLSFLVMFQVEAYEYLNTFYGFVVLMYHVDDVARGLDRIGVARRRVVFLMPTNRRALSQR